MPDTTGTTPLTQLKEMLTVSRENYDACIDHVDHTDSCDGVATTTRMHHLKCDPNGQLKVEALAECLADHITMYAASCRSRPHQPSEQEWNKFVRETRRKFRVNTTARGLPDLSGEAGEMLLYFLIEAVLDAPQVVAKVDLKTTPKLEVNGSDGIHMRWDPADQCVDVYFGESKLHKHIGRALTDAFDSIAKFHLEGMRQFEVAMATNHFKGVDDNLRAAIKDVLDTGKPPTDARLNHVCLIGYDWAAKGLTPAQAKDAVEAEYRKQYLARSRALHRLLQHRFDKCQNYQSKCQQKKPCECPWKKLRFEVFFLPFNSVQAFRDAFQSAME